MAGAEPALLTPQELRDHGLIAGSGAGIRGRLAWEQPTMLFDARRIKNCEFGAFSYVNGLYTTSLYECRVGRYCSIAEGVVAGAYEHRIDGLTTHTFPFGDRKTLAPFYELADYARLAPDRSIGKGFMSEAISTHIGHDVWIGAGAFIKRGVRIGDGAVIAAHALVTADVPPYAVVAGLPARVRRYRFDEAHIARLQKLSWWRYDLAPYKNEIDFGDIDAALDRLESLVAADRLAPLAPPTRKLQRHSGPRFELADLPQALF